MTARKINTSETEIPVPFPRKLIACFADVTARIRIRRIHITID
jgi:hypothetical protein